MAYLNSDIDIDIYMKQPKGFVLEGGDIVWKLCKTLYSTMQECYDWFKTLSQTYKDLGYKQSQAEPAIWTHYNREKFMIIYTYTDDTMSRSSDIEETERVKWELESIIVWKLWKR